jgi:hypothetical protein
MKMKGKEMLQLVRAARVPSSRQLFQPSFYRDTVPTWRSSAQEIARLAFRELEDMPVDRMLRVSESRLWGGHVYLIINEIAPPQGSLLERATAPLGMVLGKPTEATEQAGGKVLRFGTQDSVYVPNDGRLEFSGILDEKEIDGDGRIACTTSDHALSGALCHLCVRYASRYYMFRFGSGCYPLPLLSGLVDHMNCTVGGRLWQMTDWVHDYDRLGHTGFQEFYGQNALDRVLSLREAQSLDWVTRRKESFLGLGDDVFLGDPHGSYGLILDTAVSAGYFSRVLQQIYAAYIKE